MFLKSCRLSRDVQGSIPSQSNRLSSRLNEARSGRFGLSLVVGDLYQRYAQDVRSRCSAPELSDRYSVLDESTSKEVALAPGGLFSGLAELLNIPLNAEDSIHSEATSQGGFYDSGHIQHSGSSSYFPEYASSPLPQVHDLPVYSLPPLPPVHGLPVYPLPPFPQMHGSSAHFNACPIHSHHQLHPYPSLGYGRHSRTVGSRTVNLLPSSYPENGCTIQCIAMVANRSYWDVRKLASEIAGFDGSSGLSFGYAAEILESLGVGNTLHYYSDELNVSSSEFPNLAIVCVEGASGAGSRHAVVCLYTSAGVAIFDSNYPYPRVPKDYTFESDYSYIEIDH